MCIPRYRIRIIPGKFGLVSNVMAPKEMKISQVLSRKNNEGLLQCATHIEIKKWSTMKERWQELIEQANAMGRVQPDVELDEKVQAALDAAEALASNLQAFCLAMGYFARWFEARGNYGRAEAFQLRHVEIARQLGLDNRELARRLLMLGQLQEKLGKLAAGEATMREAIRTYPDSHPIDLIEAFLALSHVLDAQGQSVGAQEALAQAEQLRRQWRKVTEFRIPKLQR